jgi:hypothetical protein
MSCSRVIDLTAGIAMVVTDLHGDFDLFRRYRDRFLKLQAWGFAQTLILCGDLIHSEGPPDQDGSLEIILDVIALKEHLGHALVVLLGNHEMSHIYGAPLARGSIEYTPRFEATMGAHREAILRLFKSLPFYVRTHAGVMISHAGASPLATTPSDWTKLCNFAHDELLALADRMLQTQPVEYLRDEYARPTGLPYAELAHHYLAVDGPDDPRYDDLLRSHLLAENPDFRILWSALFTRNELDIGEAMYRRALEAFLEIASCDFAEQCVLVSGHVPCPMGRKIVSERQLRLASGEHAHPAQEASYLLFDTAQAVQSPFELLDRVHRIADA